MPCVSTTEARVIKTLRDQFEKSRLDIKPLRDAVMSIVIYNQHNFDLSNKQQIPPFIGMRRAVTYLDEDYIRDLWDVAQKNDIKPAKFIDAMADLLLLSKASILATLMNRFPKLIPTQMGLLPRATMGTSVSTIAMYRTINHCVEWFKKEGDLMTAGLLGGIIPENIRLDNRNCPVRKTAYASECPQTIRSDFLVLRLIVGSHNKIMPEVLSRMAGWTHEYLYMLLAQLDFSLKERLVINAPHDIVEAFRRLG